MSFISLMTQKDFVSPETFPLSTLFRRRFTIIQKMTREEKIRWAAELLEEESTMTLATSDADAQPWSAPLFYLTQEDLSLCWLSSGKSRHSLNLARDSRVAVSVHRSVHDWKQIRGLQMRGEAESVTDSATRSPIVDRYCERFQLGTIFRVAILKSTLYVFRPTFVHGIDNTRHFGWDFDLELADTIR